MIRHVVFYLPLLLIKKRFFSESNVAKTVVMTTELRTGPLQTAVVNEKINVRGKNDSLQRSQQ